MQVSIAVCAGCKRALWYINTELPANASGPYFCDTGDVCRNMWADALARGNRHTTPPPPVPVVQQEDNAIVCDK